MTKSSMQTKKVCIDIWLLLMCLKLISTSSQASTKLSSRIVKTKYGQLRGILIEYNQMNSIFSDYQYSNHHTSSRSPNETAQFNKFVNLNDNQHSSKHSAHSSSFQTDNIQIEAFLGVSYAQAPIGDRRFLPPVSPSHWRGI